MKDKQEEFLNIYDACIHREGAAALREYLFKSDFFRAPASTRYHCAYEGGLCEHSVNTYKRLLFAVQNEYGEIWEERVPHESIAVCGLLHDLCKIDFYKQDFRNVKENGEWVRRPYYAREELFPFGHGEKSVYIISSFMRLTREEAMAINWHMGGFDTRVKGWDPSISEAYDKYLSPCSCTFPIWKRHISTKNAAYKKGRSFDRLFLCRIYAFSPINSK